MKKLKRKMSPLAKGQLKELRAFTKVLYGEQKAIKFIFQSKNVFKF